MLPCPIPETKWLTIREWKSNWVSAIWKETDRVCRAPGWNPKMINLDGSLVMIDLATVHCGPHSNWLSVPVEIMVIRHEDHPFLEQLNKMSHVPRAVKAIYRKENRLKYLRSGEYWPFHYDMNKAESAWEKYQAKLAKV